MQDPFHFPLRRARHGSATGATVTRRGDVFLGLPQFKGHDDTPSVVRVDPDGKSPLPGGSWNAWRSDGDGLEAFIMVNSVHVLADDTRWVVDQGALPGQTSAPVTQKLIQPDPATGHVRSVLLFETDILPPGPQMNDLRIHGPTLYATDSGPGGLIIHDLAAGTTVRQLSAHPLFRQPVTAVTKGKGGRPLTDAAGHRPVVHSDTLEVTANGAWLYVSIPTGPLIRLPTAPLLDRTVSDAHIAALVETVCRSDHRRNRDRYVGQHLSELRRKSQDCS